jgi:hypothetical protein
MSTDKIQRQLRVSDIRLDFQPSENLVEETVQTYFNRLKWGKPLPPLTVRFDGQNHFLQDGFHRLEAARRLGIKMIDAEISRGTLQEMEAEWRHYLKQLKTSLSMKPEQT